MLDNPQRTDPLSFEEGILSDETNPDDFVDQEDHREKVVTYHEEYLEKYLGYETVENNEKDQGDDPGDNLGYEGDPKDNLEYYQKDYFEENHENDLENNLADDNEEGDGDDFGEDNNLEDNLLVNIRDNLQETIKNDFEMYPSLKEMKTSVVNGSFNWSKTARSILFLKKHKCASSTLREALRNYLYWRGMTEEVSIFQALGGCYPARWDPKCRPPTEFKSHVRNILYHHRLNLDEQLPRMFPDTKLITTVREPVSLLYRKFFTTRLFLLHDGDFNSVILRFLNGRLTYKMRNKGDVRFWKKGLRK